MAALTGLWTPPPGMAPKVVTEWRAFYRAALDNYGVNPQAYRDMYVAQHGVCYICRRAVGKNPDDPSGRGGRRLGIDHNHVTGTVRGLLCSGSVSANTCNRLIGRYTLAQLKRAVTYLETEPAQSVIDARRQITSVAGAADQPFPDEDGFLATVLGLR
jgi:hypothetical protein